MATATELVDDAQAYSNTQANSVQAFINQLVDAANVNYDGIIEDLQIFHTPLNVVADMLDNIAGTFPTPPTFVIPDFQVPAIPDVSFTAIEHDITTLEQARSELLSDLTSGGFGIDVNDETQLLDRTRDRTASEADTAIDEAGRVFANRRFSEPPGTLYGAMEQTLEGKRGEISEAAREIYVQRAQQFFNARQFAIQAAGVADRTRAEIKEIQFRIEEAEARFQLALFQSQLDSFRIQVQAAIDKVSLTVRVFEAHATVENARARVVAETAKVFIAEYGANVQSFLGVIDARIKNANNELAAQVQENEGKISAASQGANFYTNLVASALGAVNTVVSQSVEE